MPTIDFKKPSQYLSKNSNNMVDTKVTEKHDKFRELAEGRTNKALDAISRLGKLSNRQLYEWEDAEIRKIIKALKDSVSEVERKFSAPKGAKENKFTL